MILIGALYVIYVPSGDIMGDVQEDNTSVEMSICLVAGEDGAHLRSGKEGLVFVRVYNQTAKNICIPLFYKYGKGSHRDIKPTFLSDDVTFYAGFEIATIKYCFVDSKGSDVMERVVVCSSDSIDISPRQYKVLSIPIRTPPEPGIYKFKLFFDNGNLEKAIESYNFVDSKIKPNLFHREVSLEGIAIKE
jgi:hypothetical protein